MKGFFISGTGTDIGKTYVTAKVAQALQKQGHEVGYYKAALSGAICIDGVLQPGDAQYVQAQAGLRNEQVVVSHTYEPAVSPHLAARRCGQFFSMQKVLEDVAELHRHCDMIIAEGAGGIICPLHMEDSQILLEDVIQAVSLPLLVVTSSGLGSINATVLTIAYAKAKNLKIAGIIMNLFEPDNLMHIDNKVVIERLSGVKVLACVTQHGDIEDVAPLMQAIS